MHPIEIKVLVCLFVSIGLIRRRVLIPEEGGGGGGRESLTKFRVKELNLFLPILQIEETSHTYIGKDFCNWLKAEEIKENSIWISILFIKSGEIIMGTYVGWSTDRKNCMDSSIQVQSTQASSSIFFFKQKRNKRPFNATKCNQCTYIIHLNNEYNEKKNR